MKKPQTPPTLQQLLDRHGAQLGSILAHASQAAASPRYEHWDKLRHKQPPGDLDSEQWWLAIKLARQPQYRQLPLCDTTGRAFVYTLPDRAQELLHLIDSRASGRVGLPDEVATPEHRNRYVFNSLAEEAITSSQLEGAATTRQVAADMLRQRRRPRDRGEQMILNNFIAMQQVRETARQPIDLPGLLRLHRLLTEDTLDNPAAAGRLQQPEDARVQVMHNASGEVLHTPPPAIELPDRVAKMIDFAGGNGSAGGFVHPVIRAIVLHFWLAWDHPFEDGNGRTARALFYWSMLQQGYWLFEFISISRILKQAPAQYGRAFLETETDDNDLSYFILYQLEVIRRALEELEQYLSRKAEQLQQVEQYLRRSDLNHRQLALLSHALRHPGEEYSVKSHQTSHRVAYATARADLLQLAERGLLEQRRIGAKTLAFPVPRDLEARIRDAGA